MDSNILYPFIFSDISCSRLGDVASEDDYLFGLVDDFHPRLAPDPYVRTLHTIDWAMHADLYRQVNEVFDAVHDKFQTETLPNTV